MNEAWVWVQSELELLQRQNRRRYLVVRQQGEGPWLQVQGRRLVHFGSNDYLGLSRHPQVVQAAQEALARWGAGAGASPLILGHTQEHQLLEEALARFKGAQAALVFPTGFAANLGTITALVGRGDAIFSDQYNHASLIDAARLSRAEVFIYRHNDMEHLAQLLAQHAVQFRRKLILSDGVFSMHGDLAPVGELVELAERFGCMLLIDEAHGTGVLGPGGRGAAEALGMHDHLTLHLGTLSKALGAQGGFVAGPRVLMEWIWNRARSYIFSTALAPAACAAARAALALVQTQPQRRQELLRKAAQLRQELQNQGWSVPQGQTPIVPVFLGQERRVLQMAEQLRQRGLWVPPIRPPSVPEGQCCLRISLCYDHTPQQIAQLLQAMQELAQTSGN